jgi:hypothetical protein
MSVCPLRWPIAAAGAYACPGGNNNFASIDGDTEGLLKARYGDTALFMQLGLMCVCVCVCVCACVCLLMCVCVCVCVYAEIPHEKVDTDGKERLRE